jgi:hypothetical protein
MAFALVNPSNQPISGTLEMRSDDGQVAENLPYFISPRSAQRIALAANNSAVRIGSARIVPAAGPTPAGIAFFRFSPGGTLLTETAIPAIPAGNAFRGYAERQAGKRTGIAIANPTSSATTVTIEVTPLDGNSPPGIGTITLPPFGQRSLFLDEVPGLSLGPSFMGIVRTTSSSPIVVTGLRGRINERGEFLITATVPIDESAFPLNATRYFPQFTVGGDFQMDIILLNGQAGGGTGRLIFFAPNGRFLPLSLQRVAAVP